MKCTLALITAIVLTIASPAMAQETTLIAYPTLEEASFTIEIPADWELTPADEDGEFFHLDGPTGALFSFRTIDGTEDALQVAIEGTMEHIGNLFTDIEIGDPVDWTPDGLTGFYAVGSGKDKDGTPVRLGVAWCALNDGKIAQMWFVSDMSDSSGIEAAESIANSLSSPK